MTETSTPTRGEIVDYDIPDDLAAADPVLTAGMPVPMIVVNVDDSGTYSGVVFLTDGTTRYVHVPPPEAEPEPAPGTPAAPAPTFAEDVDSPNLAADIASLTPAERSKLIAALGVTDSPPASIPADPPASAPIPADPSPTPDGTASPEDQTGGSTP